MKKFLCFIILMLFSLSSCAWAQPQKTNATFGDVPKIIRRMSLSVVMIKAYNEAGGGFTGSGFFISRQGKVYIASAGHLTFMEKFEEKITLNYEAVWIDKTGQEVVFPIKPIFERYKKGKSDFAVFSFEAEKLPFSPAPMELADSSKLLPGDWVISIGGPSAMFPFFTIGNIAHFKFNIFIVHSAFISMGSSGGPLIDLNGRVVGMNVSMMKNTAIIGIATTSNSMLRHLEEFDKENDRR